MTTPPPLAPNDDPAPLHGLRVVEFGQYIAVPAAAQMLADLGADVVKVEPPSGDFARRVGWSKDDFGPMFTAYNRGKRSVVLDLRSETDRGLAARLAQGADVVLQNARPGVMARQGLGPEPLIARQPRLIYGQVSGFGASGPAAARPGLDIAAQAESGLMSLNGEADRDPVRVGITVVDLLASHTLANGVLAALLRRGLSGRGGLVDVSLIDVAVSALANAWADFRLQGTVPLRRGNGQATVAPAADIVRTRDGPIVVSAYTPEHFATLCALLGRPELATDPRFATNPARVANRAALVAELEAALGHLDRDGACALLGDGGVVAGAIRTMDEVRPGRAGVSADLFVDAVAPGRPAVAVPGLPFRLDGVARGTGRLPALGEHTDEVLRELRDAAADDAGPG